jgi:hypothetical protein
MQAKCRYKFGSFSFWFPNQKSARSQLVFSADSILIQVNLLKKVVHKTQPLFHLICNKFLNLVKFSIEGVEFSLEAAETACWGVANICYGKQK